jgi:LPS-assembly protein
LPLICSTSWPQVRIAVRRKSATQRLHGPLALASVLVLTGVAIAGPFDAQAQAGPGLKPSANTRERFGPALPAVGKADPVVIDADRITGRPDQETVAEGSVEFRRGNLTMRADRIEYSQPTDTVRAIGSVEIRADGNVYRGPELELQVQRFEGWFRSPSYFFGRTQAGGEAERFDFLDKDRSVATAATYTSCPAPDPAWVLETNRVLLDQAADEGTAVGAVLRFYGVPILALPIMSFPLSDARKSGWLPPSVGIDNKSGVQVAAPYYWNIAPNRDATFTPTMYSRRGAALGGEFRYLEPSYRGTLQGQVLPNDLEASRSRWSLWAAHEGRWDRPQTDGVDYRVDIQRVSDDDYWKDFTRSLPSPTPRLLPAIGQATMRFDQAPGDTETYARVLQWQVLQDNAPGASITPPYQRAPQVGVRQRAAAGGFEWGWETEINRFTNEDSSLQQGTRVHALGTLALPWLPTGSSGWTITPRASLNAAAYDVDEPLAGGGRTASRVIPTVSLDSAWVFEREAQLFGRDVTQTLEPRLFYAYTPYQNQSDYPVFDSAPKQFNITSIFSDNVFSGVDRVSDANQISAGLTTRFFDRQTGSEHLRLGLAQRLLLADQRITADGQPLTQRLSDLLLLGSTSVVPDWAFDTSLTYGSQNSRIEQTTLAARYSPGPFRTVAVGYSYNRNSSEQIGIAWQLPLNASARSRAVAEQARDSLADDGIFGSSRSSGSSGCAGAWYTVGRVNYSMQDSRLTSALMGFEYDSGCWIARVVANQQSTGNSTANTSFFFQLELVGLSRLGSNPLGVLRENVPGYQMLRGADPSSTPAFLTP